MTSEGRAAVAVAGTCSAAVLAGCGSDSEPTPELAGTGDRARTAGNAAQVLANYLVTEARRTSLSYGYASGVPDIQSAVFRAQDTDRPDVRLLTQERLDEFQADWESKLHEWAGRRS